MGVVCAHARTCTRASGVVNSSELRRQRARDDAAASMDEAGIVPHGALGDSAAAGEHLVEGLHLNLAVIRHAPGEPLAVHTVVKSRLRIAHSATQTPVGPGPVAAQTQLVPQEVEPRRQVACTQPLWHQAGWAWIATAARQASKARKARNRVSSRPSAYRLQAAKSADRTPLPLPSPAARSGFLLP
jgi:hypothetical protein